MKPEQILDLSTDRYDNIERFFNRPLTSKEKYALARSMLEVHGKYSNMLDELEYIIQRRLSEEELRNLVGDEFQEIEKRLGKPLTEKQIRNILQGQNDPSLVGVEDLVRRLKEKYKDDRHRTRKVIARLLEKLEEDYRESEKKLPSGERWKASNEIVSTAVPSLTVEFHRTTDDLLDQLSEDVRKHAVVTPESLLSEDNHRTTEEKISSDQEKTPTSSPSQQSEPIKAFESVTRTVAHIADEEHLEDMSIVNDAIEKLTKQAPIKIGSNRSSITLLSEETGLSRVSNVEKYPPALNLPAIKSIDDRISVRELPATEVQPEEDVYLGWMLFKGAQRPDLGLKEETPKMVKVRHLARTYVVGIPEEYADEKSRSKS